MEELESKYKLVVTQAEYLVEGESDLTANLANIVALIKESFGWFWIGFYLVKNDELVLGPFQGPVACTRIAKGKGVCGTAWANAESILVPDVHLFPGHIACSAQSESEIVVPVICGNQVVMVLDIDSDKKDDFSKADVDGVEKIAAIIQENWPLWTS